MKLHTAVGILVLGLLITKTNNKEKAQNQQCHYDYFKEADDQQAWELFQAVLGGTNLILEFLETNVEL